MSEYGMTSGGFRIKPLEKIREEAQAKARASFGADGEEVDVSPTSVIGQIIDNNAIKLYNLWEAVGALVANMNPEQASGIALDNALMLSGMYRLEPVSTIVDVAYFGTEGTIIPAGQLTSDLRGNQFELRTNITITKERAVCFRVGLDNVESGTMYQISIDGVFFQHQARIIDTVLTVLSALALSINADSKYFDAEVEDDKELVIIAKNGKYEAAFTAENLNIIEFASVGRASWVPVEGASYEIFIAVGEINSIVTPETGLDRVYNFAIGEIGRDPESDVDARIRHAQYDVAQGYAVDEAIEARILTEVPEVTFVKVISNRTLETDADGRPPKSFETIVVGGDDDIIAKAIWTYQPSGIESYGNTHVSINDSNGDPQDIYFSRSVPRYLWIKIKISRYEEEEFPSDGEAYVRDLVYAWGQSAYSMGKDVIVQRIYTPVYQCPGIEDVEIQVALTNSPLESPIYYLSNLPVDSREMAIIDRSRIFVEVIR